MGPGRGRGRSRKGAWQEVIPIGEHRVQGRTIMATQAVPFETPEEVEKKLALFEELFQGRYSKDGDKWFAGTCARGER